MPDVSSGLLSPCFPVSYSRSPVCSGSPLHPGPKRSPWKTNRLAYLITGLTSSLPPSESRALIRSAPGPHHVHLAPNPALPPGSLSPSSTPFLTRKGRREAGRLLPHRPGLPSPAPGTGTSFSGGCGGNRSLPSARGRNWLLCLPGRGGDIPSSPHEVPVINTGQAEGPERGRRSRACIRLTQAREPPAARGNKDLF